MLVVSGIVVGFQVVQGDLKPGVILTQIVAYGAVAGLFVGYSVARVKDIRDALRDREARFRGITNSVPDGIFQFEVLPDESQQLTFVSDQSEALLGLSATPDGYYERFVERVPPSHRHELLDSIETAVRNEERWAYEMPFDRPDGTRIWVRGISSPENRRGWAASTKEAAWC